MKNKKENDIYSVKEELFKEIEQNEHTVFRKPIPLNMVIHTYDIHDSELIKFLRHYGIDHEKVSLYIHQALIKHENKTLPAVAFDNDECGFILINRNFKGYSVSESITTLFTSGSTLDLFEDFMDFVAALSFYRKRVISNQTIVLNSLKNLDDRFIINLAKKYKTINLYLKNSDEGKRAAMRIIKIHPKAINRSALIYPGHTDFLSYMELQTAKKRKRRNPDIARK